MSPDQVELFAETSSLMSKKQNSNEDSQAKSVVSVNSDQKNKNRKPTAREMPTNIKSTKVPDNITTATIDKKAQLPSTMKNTSITATNETTSNSGASPGSNTSCSPNNYIFRNLQLPNDDLTGFGSGNMSVCSSDKTTSGEKTKESKKGNNTISTENTENVNSNNSSCSTSASKKHHNLQGFLQALSHLTPLHDIISEFKKEEQPRLTHLTILTTKEINNLVNAQNKAEELEKGNNTATIEDVSMEVNKKNKKADDKADEKSKKASLKDSNVEKVSATSSTATPDSTTAENKDALDAGDKGSGSNTNTTGGYSWSNSGNTYANVKSEEQIAKEKSKDQLSHLLQSSHARGKVLDRPPIDFRIHDDHARERQALAMGAQQTLFYPQRAVNYREANLLGQQTNFANRGAHLLDTIDENNTTNGGLIGSHETTASLSEQLQEKQRTAASSSNNGQENNTIITGQNSNTRQIFQLSENADGQQHLLIHNAQDFAQNNNLSSLNGFSQLHDDADIYGKTSHDKPANPHELQLPQNLLSDNKSVSNLSPKSRNAYRMRRRDHFADGFYTQNSEQVEFYKKRSGEVLADKNMDKKTQKKLLKKFLNLQKNAKQKLDLIDELKFNRLLPVNNSKSGSIKPSFRDEFKEILPGVIIDLKNLFHPFDFRATKNQYDCDLKSETFASRIQSQLNLTVENIVCLAGQDSSNNRISMGFENFEDDLDTEALRATMLQFEATVLSVFEHGKRILLHAGCKMRFGVSMVYVLARYWDFEIKQAFAYLEKLNLADLVFDNDEKSLIKNTVISEVTSKLSPQIRNNFGNSKISKALSSMRSEVLPVAQENKLLQQNFTLATSGLLGLLNNPTNFWLYNHDFQNEIKEKMFRAALAPPDQKAPYKIEEWLLGELMNSFRWNSVVALEPFNKKFSLYSWISLVFFLLEREMRSNKEMFNDNEKAADKLKELIGFNFKNENVNDLNKTEYVLNLEDVEKGDIESALKEAVSTLDRVPPLLFVTVVNNSTNSNNSSDNDMKIPEEIKDLDSNSKSSSSYKLFGSLSDEELLMKTPEIIPPSRRASEASVSSSTKKNMKNANNSDSSNLKGNNSNTSTASATTKDRVPSNSPKSNLL